MMFRAQGRLLPPGRAGSPRPLPPARQLAKNAAGAAMATARGLVAGHLLVDEATADRRAVVCRACDVWYRAIDERCSHPKCGCFLRLKRWLWAQTCPAGRW
jgi:hypothetical protein